MRLSLLNGDVERRASSFASPARPQSGEDAAATAVKTASQTLRDLRVAEVVEQDLHLDEGGEITFRTKLRLSFKYDVGHAHLHQ